MTAPAPAAHMMLIRPTLLRVDLNVRHAPALDPAFVDSIRELGVLVPIVAVRTDDGQLRVRYGQRRTLAAVEAQLVEVPVLVVDDAGDDAARIVGQWHENEQRAALTVADKVAAVEQLALLGVPAGDIAKRTKVGKLDVDAALATAKSAIARKATERYEFLTLDQAATLAEFEDDPKTVQALVVGASDGRFDHIAQRARDEREAAAKVADITETLTAQGVPILTVRPAGYDRTGAVQPLEYLTAGGEKRPPLTRRGHAKCPGHAAYIAQDWRGVEAIYCCTEWKKAGHLYRFGGGAAAASDGKTPEQAKEERRGVIANNKAWKSAETVRRQWLKTFLAARTPPKGAATYLATELAHWPYQMRDNNGGRHALAAELLGVTQGTGGSFSLVTTVSTCATEARAQVIALAIVLGAFESSTSVQTWRSKNDAIVRYLEFLAANGYTLSDVEKLAAGIKPGRKRGRGPAA